MTKEEDVKILYRLTWFGTTYSVDTEVNNGRGPVDTKVSFGGIDNSLIEFKLANNTQLEKNLKNQVKIYESANNTNKSIKVIVYFTLKELRRVENILKKLGLQNEKSIVLIDARNDNKPAASKAG